MGIVDDDVVVISGAAGGIGQATAALFAREGARLVLGDLGCDRFGRGSDGASLEALADALRAEGADVRALAGSVATPAGAHALLALAEREFGAVDTMVNLTGVTATASLERLTDEDWRRVLEHNLDAALYCTQAASVLMKKRGQGRIVNTTATAGMLGNYGQASYAAAAAGVYGLTRTASIELQRHGVRVNAVAPLAKTRMTEDLPIFEHVDSMRPEHVAPGYLFLGSALSSDLTGAVLALAGGKLSVFKVVESRGTFKDEDEGIWTAAEIAEHWPGIAKL